MHDTVESELSEEEIEALHQLQLGREHLIRARGALIEFHHQLGRGMGYFEGAKDAFDDAGQDELSEALFGPTSKGPLEGMWSSDLVEQIEDHFFSDVLQAEEDIREALADGERHINEQQMERQWRERAYYKNRPP